MAECAGLSPSASVAIKSEPPEPEPAEHVPVYEEAERVQVKSETALLYADHEIKDELVIGPTEITRCVIGHRDLQASDAGLVLWDSMTRCSVQLRDARLELLCVRCGEWSLTACELALHRTRCKGSNELQRPSRNATRHLSDKPLLDDSTLLEVCLYPSDTQPREPRETTCNFKSAFQCDMCGQGFQVKRVLIQHIFSHCCQKPFTGEIDILDSMCLRKYLLKPKKARSKQHSCDICYKIFARSSYLGVHMRIHTGEKPYSCDICNKIFTSSGNLGKHMRVHTGEKPYACNVCSKRFSQKCTLNIHKRVHTGEKPYSCDICNKIFTTSSNLGKHMRVHTGEKPYACNVCSKQFTQKCHLKTHTSVHISEKPYACDHCSKQFTQKGTLNIHKRVHTGEKPYSCDICNKIFTSSGYLGKHMRVHTGEKPYACNVCSKRFTQKGTLNIHKRVHTGEKPYSCDICNKIFNSSSNLGNHMRVHSYRRKTICL